MSLRRFIRRLVICTRRALAVSVVTAVLWWRWPIPIGPLPAQADATLTGQTVIIEEVAWAGSSISTADEWIELANLGDAPATVAGWALRGAGEGGRTIFLPPDAVIAPRSVYLVANYADEDAKSALAVSVDLATTTVSLSNSALGLELADADGAAVDRAGDGSAPPAGSSAPKATMIRVSMTSGGELRASWTNAAASQNFDAGTADLGTPGVCDLCASVTEVPVPSDETLPRADELSVSTSTSSTSTSAEIANPIVETSSSSTADAPIIELAADDTVSTSIATTTLALPEEVLDVPDDNSATTAEEIILPETATNADPIAEVTLATSTESVIDAATTTNSIVDDEIVTAPTNIEPAAATEGLSSLETQTVSDSPIPIFLNEAMSNPASGPEWVELALGDSNATATDRALELWDAVGRFMTIAKGTSVTAPGYLVVSLASARLNNGGDRLELRELSQDIIDATAIPELEDGVAWARRPSNGSWTETGSATPGAANSVPSPVAIAPPSSSQAEQIISPLQPAAQTPPLASGGVIPTSTVKTPAKSKTAKTPASKTVTVPKPASSAAGTKTTATSKTTAAKTVPTNKSAASKASTPKPTSKTATPAPTLYSFSYMFENDSNGVRVRVTGSVGSVPRLLGATHAFILLGEDGRGVIVYLPKHLNVPPLGATVRVMGTLTSTYKGPEIRMKTTDVWQTVTAAPVTPKTRSVDLLMPGAEDAWSITAVTGTVLDVKARAFTLDADGVEAQVNIPPAVKYRPGRLMKGDVVRVTALLDLRRDAPALLPRTPDEIEIVKHAPSSVAPVSTDQKSPFPDWTPFGAAAGAVVLTGAAKRLRELLRKRRLETLAAQVGASG